MTQERKNFLLSSACLILWAVKNWPNTSVWTAKGNVVKLSSHHPTTTSSHFPLASRGGCWHSAQVGLSEERHLLRQLKLEACWLGKFCSFPHDTRLLHGIERQAFQPSVLVVLHLFQCMYFLSFFHWKVFASPTFLSRPNTSFWVV